MRISVASQVPICLNTTKTGCGAGMSDETQGAGNGLAFAGSRWRAGQILWLMPLILCAALASPATAQDHQYSAEQIQAGYRIYVGQCQICHGFNGDGIAHVSLSR